MKNTDTHYDNLKVARNAPPEVIRAAYRALSQKFHPDINHSNPDAAQIMVIINASYEVLSNPERRREYDLMLERQEVENAHSETKLNDEKSGSKKQNIKVDLNGIKKYCFEQRLKIEDNMQKGGCLWVVYKNNTGPIASKLLEMGLAYSKKRQSWYVK